MMKKIMRALAGILAAALMAAGPSALVLAPLAAVAQSSPGFVNNPQLTPPTAAEWNGYFSGKTDYLPGATNALAYWNGSRKLVSAPASGDCTAAAANFRCTKLAGVTPGNIFPLNAGTGTSISGGNLNVTNAVPSNLTLTNPASAATFTLLGGKTLTVNNTLTLSGTDGSTLAIGAGGTLGALAYTTSPVAVNLGGTNCAAASGTCLDNITGFASTGFMVRTGAGAYSFQSATNGITRANLAQAAANTLAGNPTGSTANVQDVSMPSCPDSGGNHINWVAGTGPTCGTSSGATGALVQVGATLNASSSASLAFTGLGAYSTYLLNCTGLQPSGAAQILLQVGTGAGPTYQTANYISQINYTNNGTPTGGGNVVTNAVFMSLSQSTNATVTAAGTVRAWIYNVSSSTLFKNISYETDVMGGATTTSFEHLTGGGMWFGATTAVTAVQILYASGNNISVGQCSLYGLLS